MTYSEQRTTTSPSSGPRSTTLRIPLPRDGGTPPAVPLSADPRRELTKLPSGTLLSDRVFLRTLVDGFGCWIFGGSIHSQGYGVVNMRGTVHFAHRVSYEALRGAAPGHLDHLCRDRLCVRPDHLEAVTPAENCHRGAVARRYCRRGHDMTDEANIYIRPDGKGRQCIPCIRIRSAR